MQTQKLSSRSRLPNRRRRGLAATIGLVVGTAAGSAFVLLAASAGAYQGSGEANALLDATHLPPLLTSHSEVVELRYDVHCLPAGEDESARPCEAGGKVFVRPGSHGPYRELPLRVDETAVEERFVAAVPRDVSSGIDGFTYYAVFESEAAGATMTLPAGGASAPQRSVPLTDPVEVALGAHTFGAARKADARVLEAGWGDGSLEIGLESGRNLPPIGGSSFDVDSGRTIHVLDQVHRRILRWSLDGSGPVAVPLAIDGTIADLAIGSDGIVYVLESARPGRQPVLRTFGPAGEHRGAVEVGERTASQVRVGPGGPLVLQHPSGHWIPMTSEGPIVAESAQGCRRSSRTSAPWGR